MFWGRASRIQQRLFRVRRSLQGRWLERCHRPLNWISFMKGGSMRCVFGAWRGVPVRFSLIICIRSIEQRRSCMQRGLDGLLFLYNFDDVPDPHGRPVSPQGFDSLTGRPNDGSYPNVRWWGSAPDRSDVYRDYSYVTWAENLVSEVVAVSDSGAGRDAAAYDQKYRTGLGIQSEVHPERPGDPISFGVRSVVLLIRICYPCVERKPIRTLLPGSPKILWITTWI